MSNTPSHPVDGAKRARPSVRSFLLSLPWVLRLPIERLAASPIGRRLAWGAFWILVGTGVARTLGLLTSVATARLLGAEDFGALGIIQSTVGLFSVFAGLGLGLTTTKHVAELRQTDPTRAGRIIAVSGRMAAISGLVLGIALVVLARPLAGSSLGAPQLGGMLQISSLTVLLGAMNGVQTGALSGFEAFKRMARINLGTGLASCLFMVMGVLTAGLTGAVWSLVASLALNCVLNHVALRAEARRAGIPSQPGAVPVDWRLLWRFSLPAMLCSVMVIPVNWLSLAMLAHQPGGYAEMGIFNAANQWRNAILFVPQALAGIALPTLVTLRQAQRPAAYTKFFWTQTILIAGVALGIALLVVAASGWIMHSYGDAFAAGRGTLVLLSLTAVVMAANHVLGADVISQGRMWAGLLCNVAWAAAFLGLSSWLVPLRGAWGLAAAALISYPIHFLCLLALNLRRSQAAPAPVPAPAVFEQTPAPTAGNQMPS